MHPEDHSDPQLAAALSHLPVPPDLLRQALEHLFIDKPIYKVRVVGSRIEFHLLGGEVKSWEPPPPEPIDSQKNTEDTQPPENPAPAPRRKAKP